jgi:hypothetical protein
VHWSTEKLQLPREIARTISLGNWGDYSIQFQVYKVSGQIVAFPSGRKILVNH